MLNQIDYYYAAVSGYAYLGEPRLVDIASKYGVELRFKPIDIARVFAEAGTVPPPKQSKSRLAYRLLDLQRTGDFYKLPINPKPRYWPVPTELASRSIYAAMALGIDPHKISFAILSAVYAQDLDVSDEQVMRDIFGSLQLDRFQLAKKPITKGQAIRPKRIGVTQKPGRPCIGNKAVKRRGLN